MGVAWRRLWPLLVIGAAALEVIAYLVATLTEYVYVATNFTYCTPDQGACASFDWVPVPTHPYVALGVVLGLSGIALLGAAILVRRRTPPRARLVPVTS